MDKIYMGLVGLILPIVFLSGCGGFEIQIGGEKANKELQNPGNIALVKKRAEELINRGGYKNLKYAFELYETRLANQPESCRQRKYIAIQLVNSEKSTDGASLLRKYEKACCDKGNCNQN